MIARRPRRRLALHIRQQRVERQPCQFRLRHLHGGERRVANRLPFSRRLASYPASSLPAIPKISKWNPSCPIRCHIGEKTEFRKTLVYQISQYPSGEKRTEKAFGSQLSGTNGSNAFGNEILQPGPRVDGGGAIVVGTSRATIAARLGSSALVGSDTLADFPSRISNRIGSSWGSPWTCSSARRRYLPDVTSQSQTCTGSVPRNHAIWSETCFGSVMRFAISAVVCDGTNASVAIFDPLYHVLPDHLFIMSFIFSYIHISY